MRPAVRLPVTRGRLAVPLLGAAVVLAAAQAGPAAASWPVYHGDRVHSGYDRSAVDLRNPTTAWTSPSLDGQLFGSPVTVGSTVIVGTENNTVYALDAATGAIRWSRHLATPVASGALPCGDIAPTVGITGTPVIDVGRNRVFVAAAVGGGVPAIQHRLYGLDVATGALAFDRNVDAPGSDPAAHLQRGALALTAGRVLVSYGGNSGDCSDYRGRVVASAEDGTGALLTYTVPVNREGGIWAPGGPAVDRDGNAWVADGNGDNFTTYDTSDSVIELSPAMTQLASWGPPDWRQNSIDDADVGSTSPQLLPGGYLFQVGKQTTGFLVSTANPGGLGGQRFAAPVCRSFGNQAYAEGVIYVSCTDGMRALAYDRHGPSFRLLWHTPVPANGAPTVSGGLVWSVNAFTGTLYGLDRGTGAAVVTRTLGSGSAHFVAPAADNGRLFVAFGTHVTAFAGTPQARTAIAQKYHDLGGPASLLGAAYTGEYAVPGGVAQDFENGGIFWSAATGAHEVHGNIYLDYLANGGPAGVLGLPVTDESGTSDGVGRYNHFRGSGSIYWTPATGAHEVHGEIGLTWAKLGFERGLCGYPVTDERGTPDGVGRYNHFSGSGGASIYWTAQTGAHEVHGNIRLDWAATGWEAGPTGYPTTDELSTPDHTGRYNRFSRSAGIYWTPATGAHEVHGLIGLVWASQNWEQGRLGYPVTDEYDVPVGRESDFQGGRIIWNRSSGIATAYP